MIFTNDCFFSQWKRDWVVLLWFSLTVLFLKMHALCPRKPLSLGQMRVHHHKTSDWLRLWVSIWKAFIGVGRTFSNNSIVLSLIALKKKKKDWKIRRGFSLEFYHESESCSVISNSLQSHGLYSPRNSWGQNAGLGSCSLLRGIFRTQGSNPGLPYCRRILYQLSHKGILPYKSTNKTMQKPYTTIFTIIQLKESQFKF